MFSRNTAQPTVSDEPIVGNALHPSAVPTWLRIGIPILLAMLASALNVATVRSRLSTTEAYEFKENLPKGTAIDPAKHLRLVEVGGTLDRQHLVTKVVMDAMSLTENRQGVRRNVHYINRPVQRGELLTVGLVRSLPERPEGATAIPIEKERIVNFDEVSPGHKHYLSPLSEDGPVKGDKPLEPIGPFLVEINDATPGDPPKNSEIKLVALWPWNESDRRTKRTKEFLRRKREEAILTLSEPAVQRNN